MFEATFVVKDIKDWTKQWAIETTTGDYYKMWKDTGDVELGKEYKAEWEEETYSGKKSRRIKSISTSGSDAGAQSSPPVGAVEQVNTPVSPKSPTVDYTQEDIYVQTQFKVWGPAYASPDLSYEDLEKVGNNLTEVFRRMYRKHKAAQKLG